MAKPARATASQRFFKTGPGQYGEGDVFIGVSMPDCRIVCRKYRDLPLQEVQKLLDSKIHEHRMVGLIILANSYPKSDDKQKIKIFNLYLKNVYAGRVNNWDLVDVTAPHVIGAHLYDKPKDLLFELAGSDNLWQRRVAVLSSFYFIGKGEAGVSLRLAKLLLNDSHDLMQKAVGWMLREIGKRVDGQLLLEFLDKHYQQMPRTMLRYSIEHLDPVQKTHYMKK